MIRSTFAMSRLLVGTAVSSLALGSAGAMAQEQVGNDDMDVVADGAIADVSEVPEGAILVTGTRIQRDANEEAPSPIQTVTLEQMRQTGVIDVTEALREIPALANSGTIADSLERGAGGVGQATLNLRGLGSTRTLVVVNYVLKQDFEGFEINGQIGISDKGDGRTLDVSGVYGTDFADGRGNIAVAGGYSHIAEIQQGGRSYTRDNARYNTGQTYPNPARRFQQGEITAADMPNFFDFYTTANGRYPYGNPIPLPGTPAYDALFSGGTAPTAAEQALTDRLRRRRRIPGGEEPLPLQRLRSRHPADRHAVRQRGRLHR